MASRKITDLDLQLQKLACDHVHNCKQLGIDLLITCTWRSNEEQTKLFNQGRSTKGAIVTWAEAGQSLHNRTINGKPASLAYDVVPMVNGKPYWSLDTIGFNMWHIIGAEGEKLGLEWAGRWRAGKKEYPHFQLTNGESKNVAKNTTQA